MSSTTLVEFTDTQMLDYATDADFSMQNSPADWLAVEATMLDDNPTSATTEYSETIEIDMEHNDEHDEEITEYEMADDVIVDVDYDGDAQFQDAELDEPPIVMDSVLLSNDPNAHQHEPTQTHFALQPTELGDLSVTMAEVPSFQDAADEAAPVHTEEPTSTALHLVDGDSTLSAIPEAATSFPPATHSPVLSEEPPPFVVSVAASSDGPSYDHEAAEEIFSRANEFAEHEAAADGQGTIAAPHKGQHEESEEPLDGAPGLEGRAESFDHPGGQYAAPAEAAEFPGVEAGEDVDPHEISEGVYIDPPPAVLLSLSFTEPASLCLFNHPPSSSRSQSPGEPSTTNSAVTLILQQQPTLYYEPLNHVFAALRHEQVIYNLPQLVDNELIFEAYDMNLVIGEDNVHASQISIHDLNDTHDRVGLSGPLRLRLSSGPRFINRYQALREHMAQIALGAEEQDAGIEPASGETVVEEQPDERGAAASAESDTSTFNDAQNDERQQGANAEAGRALPEVVAAEQTKPDDSEDATAQNDQEAGHSTDEQADANDPYESAKGQAVDDTVEKYAVELTAAPPVEELDADEVHRSADTYEGGEYAEYEEFPDDDDDFGEALPEDLGGSAVDDVPQPEEDQLLDVDENDDPDSELVTAGLDEGDVDDQDEEPEHDVEPIVVPADEVLLTQETEYSEDGGTDHGTNAEFEHPENLYDYDDPLEGQDYADLNAYEAVNWDALEDPEAFDAEQAAQDDASSKQSSDTLSTLSKRSREEEDDDDESTLEGASLDSPHLKRIRTR